MYNHILIDLDDTLWDFRENSKIAMQEIFYDYKLVDHFDSFDSFYNIYLEKNHQLWDQYAKAEITKDFLALERFLYPLRTVGISDVTLAKQLGEDFLFRTTKQTRLVDGTIDLLEYLKPKYTLSIISNGFIEVQYTKIRNTGLEPYFNNIFLSEEIGFQKPDIRFFQTVLSRLKVNPNDCLVIGDNLQTDIEGALGANINAIFYNPNNILLPNNNSNISVVSSLFDIKAIL